MKVWGLIRMIFSPAIVPSAIRPWNFFDQGEKEWRRAIASAAMRALLSVWAVSSRKSPEARRPAVRPLFYRTGDWEGQR